MNSVPSAPYCTSSSTSASKGTAKVGEWVEEEADVLGDYRRAFARDPPRRASLAVMNDSDNTGEKGVSFIDWIEIAR